MNYQLPAILFLLPLFAAIAMPVVCLKHREWSRPISLAVLSAMVVVSVLNLNGVIQYGEVRYAFSGWAPPLGIEWVADGLASVVLVALSLLGLLALVFAGPTAPRDLGGRVVHFYVLILLLIAALTGIAFAGDLFNLFVFLEVAAIASYGLIGVAGGPALFAAFRYLLLGTLGASLYLLGVSYFYAGEWHTQYGRYGRTTASFIDLQSGRRRSALHVYRIGNQDGLGAVSRLAAGRLHVCT